MFRILRTRRKATRRAAVLLTLTMCAGIAGVTASMAGATETPAGLAATSVTDESGTGAVTVTWDKPTELMLSGEAAIGTYSVPVDPYDPVGTTFYGVEPGQHTVSLVLIDGGGDRSDAATVNVTVHPPAPGTPTVVEGHADGTNVTVTWSDDGSATSSDVTLAGQTLNVATPAEQVVFSGVEPGTYLIKVTAKNGGGDSTPGTGSVVVTGDTTPGAPQNVASTDDADLSVRVSWDAPASDGGDTISEYRATLTFPSGPRCDDGDGGTEVCTYTNDQVLPGTARSTVIYGLPSDQGPYTLTVLARNSVGSGPASAATTLRSMVRSSVASAPANIVATSTSPNTATVTWTAPADGGKAITDYAVALTPKLFGFVGGNARTITLTKVPAGSYTASVFAYNANGASPVGTATVTVANPAAVVPPAVAPPVVVPPVVPPAAAPPGTVAPPAAAPPGTVAPPAAAPPSTVAVPPALPTAPRTLIATIPTRGAVLTSWAALSTVNGAKVTSYIVTFAGQEKRLAGTKVGFGNVTKGTWTLKVVAVSAKGTSIASSRVVTVPAAKASATKLTLKAGLRGSDVKKLQAALRMPLKARTGQFSIATVAKVKAWQKARKLRQTGVVNDAMRTALKV